MKFRKFGKALLMTALSAGVVFGISSCVQSFTVGYLYVTGTQTASTTGAGVISGFKIDHNTGNLVPIAGLPVSSGGANPNRAVLLTGGRFIYVLNQGSTADGGPCSSADPCPNANITQFSIGGNGILAPQGTYFTQGNNPFRMVADSTGSHIFVLDHDAPNGTGCSLVFGAAITTCGDITAFSVDSTTGRLSYVLNSQVTASSGAPLPYFPIPANPIDFVLTGNFFLTLSGTPASGDSVFPYAYNGANGQLSINQNSSQPLGISKGTAIVSAGSQIFVLDDGPNTNTPPSNGQIFAFTAGTNGSLQSLANGNIPDNSNFSRPILAL
jgi:6-phosphogluconolactonase (cycloisomerase 2 family)